MWTRVAALLSVLGFLFSASDTWAQEKGTIKNCAESTNDIHFSNFNPPSGIFEVNCGNTTPLAPDQTRDCTLSQGTTAADIFFAQGNPGGRYTYFVTWTPSATAFTCLASGPLITDLSCSTSANICGSNLGNDRLAALEAEVEEIQEDIKAFKRLLRKFRHNPWKYD